MSKLPDDVVKTVEQNFPNDMDPQAVLNFLMRKYHSPINVGKDQFVRALLILLRGDVNRLKEYEIIADPRDIINQADKLSSLEYNSFVKPLKCGIFK